MHPFNNTVIEREQTHHNIVKSQEKMGGKIRVGLDLQIQCKKSVNLCLQTKFQICSEKKPDTQICKAQFHCKSLNKTSSFNYPGVANSLLSEATATSQLATNWQPAAVAIPGIQ